MCPVRFMSLGNTHMQRLRLLLSLCATYFPTLTGNHTHSDRGGWQDDTFTCRHADAVPAATPRLVVHCCHCNYKATIHGNALQLLAEAESNCKNTLLLYFCRFQLFNKITWAVFLLTLYLLLTCVHKWLHFFFFFFYHWRTVSGVRGSSASPRHRGGKRLKSQRLGCCDKKKKLNMCLNLS